MLLNIVSNSMKKWKDIDICNFFIFKASHKSWPSLTSCDIYN